MPEAGADPAPITVAWGSGTGPTDVASYDAALAEANLHEYNLATVSSVVPPGAAVDPVGTAPDLGPVGGRLWTVQARATAEGPARISAALGWATGASGGVFYEAAGRFDEAAARETVGEGLAAARELRDADLPDGEVRTTTLEVPDGRSGTAVVLAAFGRAEPMFPGTAPE